MAALSAPEIMVYTLPRCPHCSRARALLSSRGLSFEEIDVSGWSGFRRDLHELTGGRTVPQIGIDGTPVRGADRPVGLERAGILVALADGETFPIVRVRRRLTLRSVARACDERIASRWSSSSW